MFAVCQTITTAESVKAGANITVTCTTLGMTDTVQFYNNGSPRETCIFIPNGQKRFCYSENWQYQISQNVTTNQTLLSIIGVSLERDRGRWQCSYGTRKGPSKYLKVYGKSVNAFSFELEKCRSFPALTE